MKTAVILFSTHLKLQSLSKSKDEVTECDKVIFFTPQYIFDNERQYIRKMLPNSEFLCFADIMGDEDGENIDIKAFEKYKERGLLKLKYLNSYAYDITKEKNYLLIQRIEENYKPFVRHIYSNDLGIDINVWQEWGYKYVKGDYYYNSDNKTSFSRFKNIINKRLVSRVLTKIGINYPDTVKTALYKGKLLVFYGRLERAGYRFNLTFEENKIETFKHWIVKILYNIFKVRINRPNIINISTLHEYGRYANREMLDIPESHNYLVQDGLLPCNDCCKYLFFYGKYTHFLSWDKLGNKLFEYHNIPVEIMPFRKVFPLPSPVFKNIKKILCVSSGAGDWTAIKNRSDEDKTAAAFVDMAKRYPQIEFVYRCHPTWVSPTIQGVNSIMRLIKYFDSTNLSNIKVSTNIPSFLDENGNIVLSQKRSSLASDLQDSDFVFGVHSISMLDAAMEKIPFASVNLSGRRNLFKGITDLGFPHCESINDIISVITSVSNNDWQANYLKAINNYNKIIIEN